MQNWISTPDQLKKLSHKLLSEKVIALDTEFLREHTFFPIVALIQVATKEAVWLIDPLAFQFEDMRPFLDVLEDKKVLKILHAAQSDQECFYTTYGVVASPVFDTAAGASLCGYGESVGLAKLLKEEIGVQIKKGHARTDWTKRPLSEHLLTYAMADVECLVLLYESLRSKLEKVNRFSWAMEISSRSEKKSNYESNPEYITKRLSKSGKLDRRGVAILGELVAWREIRVRDLDVPRKRVAEDDVLVDLSCSRPRDMQHLASFRGLNKGELKNSGEKILEAIARGLQMPEDQLPDLQRPDIPTVKESKALDVLQVYLKILADEMDLSLRLLIAPDKQLLLIRKKFLNLEQMVEAGVFSAEIGAVVGPKILDYLSGKTGITLVHGNVLVKAF